jgi:hypothetical protein
MTNRRRLTWNELDKGDKHPWYIAKDASGAVYKIRPVYYTRTRKFAGYRITVGNVSIRGFKTMLHDAKTSAQRFASRQQTLAIKTVKSRGKRDLDLDVRPIEIERPSLPRRMIDLD